MEDEELKAMNAISQILDSLNTDTRARIVRWLADKYAIAIPRSGAKEPLSREPIEDLADLFVAANPKTQPEKALVVGYWFQELQGQADLNAQQVNAELKNLGHGISKVTRAFDKLIGSKPQLVIQVKKGGKTKQARKKYKLTREGIQKVETMISARNEESGE